MDSRRFALLVEAIGPARKALEPFRQELKSALDAYTGPHYGRKNTEDRPINMLQLSVDSMLQQLSSRAPQVLCTTHKPELRSSAIEMELAMNQALQEMGFEGEHRMWVLSAIFCVGIMEVGLDVVDTVEVDGEEIPITEIFCEAIMFDDFVFDVGATKWDHRQIGFMGHKYMMPLEDAKREKSFDAKAREQLQPVDSQGEESSSISNTNNVKFDRFQEMCEIWQIYVPSENEVVTFSVNGGDRPLKTVKWKGPRHGPYHLLGFSHVLNNILPLPPVANWIDIDDLENRLFRKLGRQASRQKTVGIVDHAAVQDGQNIIAASDGDVVPVSNPGSFKEASFGGVDQNTLGFALNVRGTADFIMGNLSQSLGLGASADTLGQEKMIRQAANVRVASMQGVLLSATQAVLKDIAFYLHSHPTIEMDLTMNIPGMDMQLPVKWPYRDDGYGREVDVRKGEWNQYDIKIQPYSMTEVSPGERANLLRSIWAQDILPAVQLGLQPDVYAYLSKLSKYLDLPELQEIVPQTQQAADPQEMLASKGGPPAPAAGKPNGQYTRNNVSRGMTPQAELQQQAMMAMSGGSGK